jgi:hypothetical protein
MEVTMSAVHTTPEPAAPAAGAGRRQSSLFRLAGGGAVATALAIVAVAVWPASEADKAREDGKQLGEAVSQLSAATSATEVDAALIEVRDAAAATADHAGDNVSDQVSDQADALSRAADGFVGMHTTDSEWDAELYEAELDVALDDLDSQAEQFRSEGPEVQQAFWDGYENGLSETE